MGRERPTEIFTIGHSSKAVEGFVGLLRKFGIQVVVDVRSVPYSAFAPQFNREPLSSMLERRGIHYQFEGEALGGRPDAASDGSDCYTEDGFVRYWRVAHKPWFRERVRWLIDLARGQRVAIMCAEADPAECHRHLLIARVLDEEGVTVSHILADGTARAYRDMSDVRKRSDNPPLFPEEEDPGWRSVRSVSPSGQRRSSSRR